MAKYNLEFGTIDRLIASLEVLPDNPSLIKARDSDDLLVLKTLNQSDSILERVKSQRLLNYCGKSAVFQILGRSVTGNTHHYWRRFSPIYLIWDEFLMIGCKNKFLH